MKAVSRALGLLLLLGATRIWASAPPAPTDRGFTDWTRRPFSDLASHGVLRRMPGLLAWRLDSARAFGSQAALPNGAKRLFDFTASVRVDRGPVLFAPRTVRSEDGPLWAVSDAGQDGLTAQAVTLFADRDAVLSVLSLRNSGSKPLSLRFDLSVTRAGQGLAGSVERSGRYPAVWLSLDRSQAVGRELVEAAGVWLGGPNWGAVQAGLTMTAGRGYPLADQGLALDLAWTRPLLLRPGQSMRLPFLAVWGTQAAQVQSRAERVWRGEALPGGKAYAAARGRWAALKRPLPARGPRERLFLRAVLALFQADYGRQAALSGDEFSAEKGLRDAFFSVDTPMAALGWSELDFSKAEGAVLDLAGFSAAVPAAVPPFTGDEKLAWDAAGLPLNALAAWELYHRDPDASRAARFLAAYAPCLRHECAWWPANRGGAGDGLYAYSETEEMPAYLHADAGLEAGASAPRLNGWSLALSSLVAWQMQLGSVLAQASGAQDEAVQSLALARLSRNALHAQDWDLSRSAMVQGLDGIWPLYLGLEADQNRAQAELQQWFLTPAPANGRTWMQESAWQPWRIYFLARTLAEYGYLKQSDEISENILNSIDKNGYFPQEISPSGGSVGINSAATAAVCLELLLKREQQDAFLTENTGEFTQSFIQFRSIDGSFYLKRIKIPKKIAIYDKISIETLKHGKILTESAFIISAPSTMTLQMQSGRGMDISRLKTPTRLIFEDAHKVEFVVPAHQRFLVRFLPKSN